MAERGRRRPSGSPEVYANVRVGVRGSRPETGRGLWALVPGAAAHGGARGSAARHGQEVPSENTRGTDAQADAASFFSVNGVGSAFVCPAVSEGLGPLLGDIVLILLRG